MRRYGKLSENLVTRAQESYLEILFNDCYFTGREQRNSWLSQELGRPIKYISDMNKLEASNMIEKLKQLKDQLRSPTQVEKQDD